MKINKSSIIYGFKKRILKEEGKIYILSNENEQIEFKKSFHSSSERISKDYLPTIAGFANNKGGVLIFGIDPDTNEILGIKEKYKTFDTKCLSNSIKENIDGSLYFDWFTFEIDNILIGFILIATSPAKPAILKNNVTI